MEKSKKSSELIKVIVKTPMTSEEASNKIKELSKRISKMYSNLIFSEKTKEEI